MDHTMHFPGLGLTISTADKAKVAELVKQYPEVRRAFEKLNAVNPSTDGKEAKAPGK